MKVYNIVQEAVIKIIPKKKEYKMAKWLSEEALQMTVKRRELKNKGEKERDIPLNAEFQRIGISPTLGIGGRNGTWHP